MSAKRAADDTTKAACLNLRKLREIQRQWAALILADGPWGHIQTNALGALVAQNPHAKAETERLRRLIEAYHADPREDDLEEVAFSVTLAWADAAYLLGLAVGSQLGPALTASETR